MSLIWRAWLASWAPLAVLVLHAGLAAALGHRREYDPAFHFLGGAAGAHCLLRALEVFRGEAGSLPGRQPLRVVLIVMVAVTGVWEIVELGSDRVLGTRVQVGFDDTVSDIMLGVLGALGRLAFAGFAGERVRA